MVDTRKYKGYAIWVRQTRMGCHGPLVYYAKVYKDKIEVGTHVHVTEYKDEPEQAVETAKEWIDGQ